MVAEPYFTNGEQVEELEERVSANVEEGRKEVAVII